MADKFVGVWNSCQGCVRLTQITYEHLKPHLCKNSQVSYIIFDEDQVGVLLDDTLMNPDECFLTKTGEMRRVFLITYPMKLVFAANHRFTVKNYGLLFAFVVKPCV